MQVERERERRERGEGGGMMNMLHCSEVGSLFVCDWWDPR